MILIFIGAIISFLATFIAFREKSSDNIQNLKSNRWTNYSFVIAVTGIIITIWAGWSTSQENKTDKIAKAVLEKKYDSVNNVITLKEDSIKRIAQLLNIATDTIKNKTGYILSMQNNQLDTAKKILDRSLAALDLQSKSYKEITGNGNKPTLSILASKIPPTDTVNNVTISLENPSKYPIFGARVQIFDVSQNPRFQIHEINYPAVDIAPRGFKNFYDEKKIPDPHARYSYMVLISWSRGQYEANVDISGFSDTHDITSPQPLEIHIKYFTQDGKPLPIDYFEPNNHY